MVQHYAREMDGLEYFLTYADNNAVGYFSKQSFTKNVTLEKDKVGDLVSALALLRRRARRVPVPTAVQPLQQRASAFRACVPPLLSAE